MLTVFLNRLWRFLKDGHLPVKLHSRPPLGPLSRYSHDSQRAESPGERFTALIKGKFQDLSKMILTEYDFKHKLDVDNSALDFKLIIGENRRINDSV